MFNKLYGLLLVALACLILICTSVYAENISHDSKQSADSVVRDDNFKLGQQLKVPVICWHAHDAAPRAVILAIHGVTLHAGVFDVVARDLASHGYYVIAPDLRGFGRWRTASAPDTSSNKVSFYESRADIVKLLCLVRQEYNHVPIYAFGESLGANMSLWLASVCPDLVDGIALSSPCIDRRIVVDPTIIIDTIKAAFDPGRQVPIAPYAKHYLSEDKRIVQTYLEDPMMRKRISVYESLQSTHTNRSCLWFTDQIPANKPVLLIEGEKDKMYHANAAAKLVSELPVKDSTVCMLQGLGHIHFETPYVHEKAQTALIDWLDKHTAQYSNELAASNLSRVDP